MLSDLELLTLIENISEESKMTKTPYIACPFEFVTGSFFFGIFLKLLASIALEEIYFLFFGIFLKLLYTME